MAAAILDAPNGPQGTEKGKDMRMGEDMRRSLLLSIVGGAVIAMAMAGSASALSGKQPLVVVLCKFTDQTDEPRNVQYFQDLFSETGTGESNVFDFWKDVSYGNLDLTGTVVKGWYTAKKTVAEFNGLPRDQQIDVCAKEAVNDVDFSKFAGVAVVVNNKNLNGPLFGKGPPTVINGTTYNSLGQFATEWDQAYNGILHESLHAFGLNHSRAITNPATNTDYNDLYDIGSCFSCIGTPDKVFRDQGADLPPGAPDSLGGPGLNAVQLLNAGWLAANRVLTLSSSSCAQQTVQLAALNHPEAAGYLAVRVPAAVPIFAGTALATTGDYYTVELRDQSGWDAGIVRNGVLVHLHGQDGYSYWLNANGAWGAYSGAIACQSGRCALLRPGGEYADGAKQNFYVAVNSIDEAAHTAVVTIASKAPDAQGDCKIDTSLAYSGATRGDYGDSVTLAADLLVAGTTAPIPDATVSFKLGTQGCAATTDEKGHAACSITLKQFPGAYNVSVSFAGDAVYDPASASAGFTLTGRVLETLGDAELWIGLKNSDDQGTQFDVMVELLQNGTPVAQGVTRCITGLTRNPSLVKKAVVSWDPFSALPMSSRDALALRVSTRIGTTPTGAKCSGPGGSHSSAVGLRLYYDGATRKSGFDATIAPSPPNPSGHLYLHSNGSACPSGGTQSTGVTTRSVNTTTPNAAAPKCNDSGIVDFSPANLFAVIGTWSLSLP
jgi:hypothetical protein